MGNHNFINPLPQKTHMATVSETTTPQTAPQELVKPTEETLSTVSVSTLQNEEVIALQDGTFLLPCNICAKPAEAVSDACQHLSCGHLYLAKKDARDSKPWKSKFEEMVFRMKAVMQGNDDHENKKLVDDYYERNDKFMAKYPMYSRYKTGLQNLALLKKQEKKSFKSKWSKVRSKIKSLTWIYKTVQKQSYSNF